MISKSLLSGIAGLGTVGTGGYAVIHFGLLDSYIPAIPSWKLGLPSGCVIPKDNTEVECQLTKEQLKEIKFKETSGKTSLTVTGLDASGSSVNLKIKKLSNDDKTKQFITDSDTRFTFSFTGSTDVVIKENDDSLVTLKKGTDPEFKLKKGKLERAWTPETLIGKIDGFSCTGESTNKKCSFNAGSGDKKIKVKNDSSIQEVTVDGSKLTDGFNVSENEDGYNQGFKFTYAGNSEATLDSSVTISANSCYEVKYDSTNEWYLEKKTANQ